jgi:hypothetical protein
LFLKILCPVALLLAPTAVFAGASADGYEVVRAPAGKTVLGWRQVNRQENATITCPHDSTKAFWCGARKAELSAQADARKAERLSER